MVVDFVLKTPDGKVLNGSHWQAERPHLLLLWLHGYGEYRLRYSHFASWMMEKQVSVAIVDLRGHGHSTGYPGFIKRYEEYFWDVETFVSHMVQQGSHPPVVLGGHSNGGLLLIRYLQVTNFNKRISAAVTTSPFLGLALPVPRWKRILATAISKTLPRFTMPSGLDKIELTHNTEIMEKYRRDPLIFKSVPVRWFTEAILHQKLAFEHISQIDLPFLFMQGMEDNVASTVASREFFEGVKSQKDWIGYPDMYHEILNEIEREKVYSDMYNWLKPFCRRPRRS